jgi:predicted Zn-dependent protease
MKLFPLLAFGLYMMFYYFHNQQTVPITGRTHLVDTSLQQDAALGLQSYNEILSSSKIISSGAEAEMVARVGERLKKVVEDPGFDWKFTLIDSRRK